LKITDARVLRHVAVSEAYRILSLKVGAVAASAKPGQFIHVQIPRLRDCILRRPFSIYAADDDCMSILYKAVGRGTRALIDVREGESVNVMGPLGNGFPMPASQTYPVLVAGGYGVAPLCFLARRLRARGSVFIGGASSADILCDEEFRRLRWDVQTATVDGSAGRRGLVTDVLDTWLRRHTDDPLEFYACGPDGMLLALAKRSAGRGWNTWVSLDKHMGCGMGACLACVVKVHAETGGERWARVCRDGPVFEARQVVWGKNE
jgi:dihydroorotate dehydrogenase electron transfer subunit